MQLHIHDIHGWDFIARSRLSILTMLFLYALPLSVIPPVMIYYAGINYGGGLLPALSESQLQIIGAVFFLAEIVMVFLMAGVIHRLGEVVDIEADYDDAFKLAVVIPIPLWLAPLFLVIPSYTVNLVMGSLAIVAAGILAFRAVPEIFKIEEKGRAMLLSSLVMFAGMVAWVALMLLTLITWSAVTSTLSL
ncbi:MAG: DUF1282 family protein [Sulfuricella sp.]|nr:DUF1282 family protein [Sulfuricella sp.]